MELKENMSKIQEHLQAGGMLYHWASSVQPKSKVLEHFQP